MMNVKTIKCSNCGAPLESSDATKCQYCGALLSISQKILSGKGFRGIARNVQQRQENGYTILSFRVEQIDNEGNISNYTQVELRDQRIKGALVDGDKVEIEGEFDKEGILKPKRILNLRTKANIAKTSSNKGVLILIPPFVLGAFGFVIGSMNRSIGPMEGVMGGFIAGCFLAVFLLIIGAALKK